MRSQTTRPQASSTRRRAKRTRPAFNAAESPVAWLSRRRDKDGRPLVTQPQLDAAERLRADFWFARMTPRVTTDWSATASSRGGRRAAPGAGAEILDSVIAAAERVRRALAAVGPELAGILIDVCCHLKGLEETERLAGWPQRSGKVVLQLALTRLARHYGFIRPGEEERPEGGRMRHWGAEGFKPSLEAWE